MKIPVRCIYILCLLFLLAVEQQKTYASHSAGGELLYEWVSDSSYRVILKFYRDCSGIPANIQVPLCISNSCGKQPVTGLLQLLSVLPDGSANGRVVAGGCPGYGNACTTPGSPIPGYEEWWYDDTITLTGACTEWRFSVSINARNSSNNIKGSDLFLEATLNNAAFAHNNSPVFSIKPVPYCLLNFPYYYNNGVTDTDNDSLVFENIIPMYTGSNCGGLPVAFEPATPPLNVYTNPFQTNNTYSLDSETGSITFIPALQGAQTTTIRAKEYRNGTLVGSVIRDIQVQVITGANPDTTSIVVNQPQLTNCVYRGGVLYVCTNRNVSFCFNILSTYTAGHLVIADNHTKLFPGGNLIYTNQATSNVQGCYTFTTPNVTTKKNLLVMVKDSSCKPPTGIIFYQVFTIPIVVSDTTPQLSVIKDYTYCQNDPAIPLKGSGTGLLWYVAGNSNGTTTPPIPNTTIVGTNIYYAEANNGCYSVWDTIKVNTLPKAEAEIIVSVDTVCVNEILTIENKLYKTGINYTWNTNNAIIVSNNSNQKLTAKWDSKGLKKVHLYAYNSVCNQSDSVYIYVTDIIIGGYFTIKDEACVGEKVSLILDVKNNRSYLLQTEDTTIYNNVNQNYLLSWINPGKKYATLTTKVETCVNNPFTRQITIHPLPALAIKVSGGKLCANEKIELYTEEEQDTKYYWYPQDLFESYFKNKTKLSKGLTTPVTISVEATSGFNCTLSDSLELRPEMCCTFLLPNVFSPNGDGLNDMFGVIRFMSVTDYTFIVTNRWGQVIFKTNDVNSKWDGSYKSIPQDIGTYNYIISYKCTGDAVFNKVTGSVQLIR